MAEVRRYTGSSTQEVERKYEADREEMGMRGLEPGTEHRTQEKKFLRTLYVLTVEWVPEKPWRGVRFYPSGSLRYSVETPAEARDAIKQIRMRKREIAIEKKELTTESSFLRSRNRGQTNSSQVGKRLSEIGVAKAHLDNRALLLDKAILQLDQFIADPSAGKAEGGG